MTTKRRFLISLAVEIPLMAGGVYSYNRYDEWKAPVRAGFLESKKGKAHIKSYNDDKRSEIESERKKSTLISLLHPGKTEFSRVIIDKEPFGSADLYIHRMIKIKKDKEEVYDKVEDLSQVTEERRSSVQKAYAQLLSYGASELE